MKIVVTVVAMAAVVGVSIATTTTPSTTTPTTTTPTTTITTGNYVRLLDLSLAGSNTSHSSQGLSRTMCSGACLLKNCPAFAYDTGIQNISSCLVFEDIAGVDTEVVEGVGEVLHYVRRDLEDHLRNMATAQQQTITTTTTTTTTVQPPTTSTTQPATPTTFQPTTAAIATPQSSFTTTVTPQSATPTTVNPSSTSTTTNSAQLTTIIHQPTTTTAVISHSTTAATQLTTTAPQPITTTSKAVRTTTTTPQSTTATTTTPQPTTTTTTTPQPTTTTTTTRQSTTTTTTTPQPTTTATSPPSTTTEPLQITTSFLNHKDDPSKTLCASGGAGALILDKGNTDHDKLFYIECRLFQKMGIVTPVTTVQTGITASAEECGGNGVLVGFTGKTEANEIYNWENPYYLTGTCKEVTGWTVDRGTCVTLDDPYHGLRSWTGKKYTGDTSDWDRYFDCPRQYLAVQLTRKGTSGVRSYYSVKCCQLLPAY